MYPKVFADYAATVRKYGPVSTLPTPTFFYGMAVGEEISVEFDRGKALIIRLQALGEAEDDGQVKVFFELNGQPRIIKVPDRSAAVKVEARRKADEADPGHVAAPMPGLVTTISVKPGQEVKQGEVLLSIEAMKMETVVPAPRDGRIGEILVAPGNQIDAKDLLLTLAA
jgi:pyruvate carboxylase